MRDQSTVQTSPDITRISREVSSVLFKTCILDPIQVSPLEMNTYQWTLGARVTEVKMPTSNADRPTGEVSSTDIPETSLVHSEYGGPYYCITAPIVVGREQWGHYAVSEKTPTIMVEMWYNIPDANNRLEGIIEQITKNVKTVLCPTKTAW